MDSYVYLSLPGLHRLHQESMLEWDTGVWWLSSTFLAFCHIYILSFISLDFSNAFFSTFQVALSDHEFAMTSKWLTSVTNSILSIISLGQPKNMYGSLVSNGLIQLPIGF